MKPLTYEELAEKLKRLDELTLLELLGINSEELVNAFQDKVEKRFEHLESEMED